MDPKTRAEAWNTPPSAYSSSENEIIYINQNLIRLVKLGETVAEIELDERRIDHALFTYFGSVRSLVAVAGDMLYCFSNGGEQYSMTLPFAPTQVLSCARGLILVASGRLYLMTDPMKLLGLVLPSSTSTIDPDSEPIFFGNRECSLAVFKSRESLVIYNVRYLGRQRKQFPTSLRPRGVSKSSIDRNSTFGRSFKRTSSSRLSGKAFHQRLSSRLSDRLSDRMSDRLSLSVLTDETSTMDMLLEDFDYKKEAVLTFVNKIEVGSEAELQVIPQLLQNWLSLCIIDSSKSVLHHLRYSHGNTFETYETFTASAAIPLSGFEIRNQQFPFLALLSEGHVMVCSPVFKDQQVQITPKLDGKVLEIAPSASQNSFMMKVGDEWERVQLAEISCPLVGQCINLLGLIMDAEFLSQVLLDFITVAHVTEQWKVFEAIIVSRLAVFHGEPSAQWLKLAFELSKSNEPLKTSDIIIYLHLLREDLMLQARKSQSVQKLGHLLSCLTSWANWSWESYYRVDGDPSDSREAISIQLEQVPGRLPVIFESFVSDIQPPQIPYPDTSAAKEVFYHTNVSRAFFQMLSASNTTVSKMMQLLKSLELTPSKLETFSTGPRFCIMEILSYMQIEASENEFSLLNRRDLAATLEGRDIKVAKTSETHDDDHLNVTRLIFGVDRRFHEVLNLLQITKSQQCNLPQPPNSTEHEWFEMQQAVANLIANRTLAAAFGRAAIYFSSKLPVISERLELPKINFDVFLRDHNVSVVFNPDNLNSITRSWGYLAHGVAAGLSIAREANVTSHWIVYNNALEFSDSPARHAGFLLGLGIMGHLRSLEEWHIYQYLGSKIPVISNALLLGLAASQMGTMNVKLTKVLSVHITALLPLGSSDLNVKPDTQTAAIIAVGLLYLSTQNRRMSEVMLSELRSDATDRGEMYRTACGMALGLMNLGKGRDLCGLFDVALVEKLQASVAIQTDAIPLASLQLSQSGSIIALMLMFLGTNDEAVAASLASPTSSFLAEYTRPDVLYTRSMARNLVLLDSIEASREWVEKQIPAGIYQDITKIDHHDSDLLPFYNLLCGTLMSVGIKFAGTGDENAISTILFFVDEFRRLTQVDATSVDERICKFGIMNLQSRVVVAAAVVAAGRGSIPVLQRLRPLFVTTTIDFTYDEFVGVSMAMGILFLGGGQYSFDCSTKSRAFLAISLMSLAGAESEAASWEHLRFFWAFAAEKRCLIVRDVDTHAPVQVDVEVTAKSGKKTSLQSPCLLPPVDSISSIAIKDKLLLLVTISFDDASIGDLARKVTETRTIFVQKVKSVSASLADRLAGRSMPRWGDSLGEFLYTMACKSPPRPENLWNLRLVLAFADSWRPNEELRLVPRRWLDKAKAKLRLSERSKSTIFD